jgi:hypothetical protein
MSEYKLDKKLFYNLYLEQFLILIRYFLLRFYDSCGLDENVAAKYDKQGELYTDWQYQMLNYPARYAWSASTT